MEMHGFDLNPDWLTASRMWWMTTCQMETSLSTTTRVVKPLKDERGTFDAIITDPPYLNCTDLYTDDPEDLSNMKQPEWEDMMREAFRNYHRLIKKSSVKDKPSTP